MKDVSVKNLSFSYRSKDKKIGAVQALRGLDADFSAGGFHVIVGYSGCGKTTLLRCIAGLEAGYTGEILFDGVNTKTLDMAKARIAFVSQQFILYPKMTIFDNIAFPLLSARMPKDEIVRRVYKIAEDLGIAYCLTRKPHQISGGQQQRVAIARALVKEPQICLLDEPLSNVDPQQRTEQRQYIKKALKAAGCTVIYVTHDIREAMALSDRLYVMDEGRFSISGDPLAVYESDDPIMKSLITEV